MGFIELKETAPNKWRCKYEGNYGVYTIQVTMSGGRAVDYSCSCPSDYYPCKHIAMAEEAINERMKKEAKSSKEIDIRALLKNVSQEELVEFVCNQTQCNSNLQKDILLTFASRMTQTTDANRYMDIIGQALDKIDFDEDDIYYDNYYSNAPRLEVLDDWLYKAQEYLHSGQSREALLVCKACMEQFSLWLKRQLSDTAGCMDGYYETRPFEILGQLAERRAVDAKELFDYCRKELTKSLYTSNMRNGFLDVMLALASQVGSEAFLKEQEQELRKIADPTSWDAKRILDRTIRYYQDNNQAGKAWDTIKQNLQIESYRKEWVQHLMEEKEYSEAKRLIEEFLLSHADRRNNDRRNNDWYELKLRIAQMEGDIASVRALSFWFIRERYVPEYFRVYKSTFCSKPEEWETEMEELIKRYQGNSPWFVASVADVLYEEKKAPQLMHYVAHHLTTESIGQYYTGFSSLYPDKALELFRVAIDKYAAANTGRNYYKTIASQMKKMRKIEGGNAVVDGMLAQYRQVYKYRRAMMEILGKV
ncbi:MAG: SWIM zinc finger domain-containing protein [Mediterranea sp.]|jgi:hypothetical protein|nr:SWIM zinc finger domain-containing protein [Mediterranea sp.]